MSELDVAALLAHPANGGLEVVVGGDAVWEQVRSEASEDDLTTTQRTLAILTGPPPSTTWHLDALLRRLRARGYTGLALPAAAVVDPANRAVAQRIGVVVLRTGHPAELAKACWELLEGRDALALGYVRRVARTIEYRASDLGDLLRHLAAGIGHGVALVDAAGVLQEAGEPLSGALHARIDFTGWLDLVPDTGAGAAASVRVDSERRRGLRLVIHDRGLDATHLRAVGTAAEVAMPAVAARILIDEVVEVSEASRASSLLGEFLEHRGRQDADVEERMRAHGWSPEGHHIGFRLLERDQTDTLDLLSLVGRELRALPTAAHATTRGRGVTGWLTFAQAPSPAQVERAVRALRELHQAVGEHAAVATGIGSASSGAAGLYATLIEATDAARIAVGRAATGWFLHIDRLGLDQLLMASTGSDTFLPAATSLLAPLSPELLATLRAYLDHESQLVATAAALGTHRNTVSVRVHRIQDLLGVDLTDPDVRLALHLACRALAQASGPG